MKKKRIKWLLTLNGKTRKLLIIMKLTIVLVFAFVLGLSANTLSQQKVNLRMGNTTYGELFKEITHQTGHYVIYNNKRIDKDEKIVVNFVNVELDKVLKCILEGKQLKYVIKDEFIIITPVSSKVATKQLKKIIIKGKVVDSNGEPLPGVTVLLKGTNIGVSTNVNGKFGISIPKLGEVLVFSFIGMKTKEVVVNKKILFIELDEVASKLDEVVAIGYGTAKKKDLTGSVTRVSGESLKNRGYTRITDALIGQATGVEVLKSGGANGMTKIRIRGDANFNGVEPLIVVDGFPMDKSFKLDDLVLEDVQNLDILKGASSAAIYGSKAAGGVILITTKKAKKSEKINVDVTINTSFKQLASPVCNLSIDELKYVYYRTLFFNSKKLQKSVPKIMGEGDYDNYFISSGFWKDKNYDWPSEMMTNGMSNTVNVAISNRNDISNYRISFNYDDINGLVEKDSRKNIIINGQLGYKYNKYISHNISASFTKTKAFMGPQYSSLFEIRPDQPLYDKNGEPAFIEIKDKVGDATYKDTPLTKLYAGNYDGFDHKYNINSDLQIKINQNITFNSRYGIRRNVSRITQYENRKYSIEGKNSNGKLSDVFKTNKFISFENTLSITKMIKRSFFDLVFGQSYEETSSYRNRYALSDFPSDKQSAPWQNGKPIQPTAINGEERSAKSFSLFSRLNYSYNNLSVTSSIRMDQSSRFSDKNNKAYFPSIALAYTMSNSKFIRKFLPVVSYCKLRASIGNTGNNFVGEYDWRNLYNSSYYANNSATYLQKLGNDKLKWEKVEQTDLGLEFSLFKGSRIHGEISYYAKKTTDILFQQYLPIGTGIDGNMYVNLATVKNKGLEISFRNKLFDNKNHKLNFNFNVNFNSNKVLDIDEQFSDIGDPELTHYIVTPGQPLGRFYGFVTDGVLRTQEEVDAYNRMNKKGVLKNIGIGDYKIVDSDCNGFITIADRQVIGQSNPDFHGGFTFTYNFKGLNISTSGKYSVGGQRYWKGLDAINELDASPRNYLKHILNTYPFDKENAMFPAATFDSSSALNNRYLIDKYIYDADYLQISSLSISYDFNRIIKSKIFRKIDLNASVNKLFTFTSYPGIDVVSYADDAISGISIDNSSYPRERTYSFTLKLNF